MLGVSKGRRPSGRRFRFASALLASSDEVPDCCTRPLRRIGHDGVAAIGKPLELHEMRRQGRCDIRLTFDRVHRVVLAAEHQSWALDSMQIRHQVVVVALASGSGDQNSTSERLTARRAMSGSRGLRK